MSQPSHSTIKLFRSIIRLAKGMITACEDWVKENEPKPQ